MKALLLALLLCAAPARAEVTWRWSRADIAMQATFVGVTVIDWCQTINFTQNTGHIELNPILGPWPSRARVNTLIPLGIVAHAAVAAALPRGFWRSAWQGVTILAEVNAVFNNVQIGAGIALPW